MADDNEHKPLSKEDRELWEKVQKTVSPVKGARVKENASENNQECKPDNLSDKDGKSPSLNDDFTSLLQETELSPASQSAPIKPSAQKNLKSDKKSQPQPQNKIESFDYKAARKLSSGKQTIDAAIDLHGLTQRQAKPALTNFLMRAQKDDKRHVLVITGKGMSKGKSDLPFELGTEEPGILKRNVPNWLDDLPEIVLSHTKAHQRHGGEGALYVRLRKSKLN